MKKALNSVLAAALLFTVATANAALFTSNFGSVLPTTSNCDDCADGPIAFSGINQSITFFGATYSSLYVSSNGYVTFDSPSTNFTSAPLDTQTVGKMIAGSFTDLDSRDNAPSNVYANTSTNGQIIVTYENMGHFSRNYAGLSTFQIVVRSDQFAFSNGEGQVGLFYGSMTDTNATSSGFGDGLSTSNPGEVALASLVPGSTLSNSSRFYNLEGGIPVNVPEPTTVALLGLGLLGFAASRRTSAKSKKA